MPRRAAFPPIKDSICYAETAKPNWKITGAHVKRPFAESQVPNERAFG
jgi:hypothetical protein